MLFCVAMPTFIFLARGVGRGWGWWLGQKVTWVLPICRSLERHQNPASESNQRATHEQHVDNRWPYQKLQHLFMHAHVLITIKIDSWYFNMSHRWVQHTSFPHYTLRLLLLLWMRGSSRWKRIGTIHDVCGLWTWGDRSSWSLSTFEDHRLRRTT